MRNIFRKKKQKSSTGEKEAEEVKGDVNEEEKEKEAPQLTENEEDVHGDSSGAGEDAPKEESQGETETEVEAEAEANANTKKEDAKFSFEYTSHDGLYGQTIPIETQDLLSTKFRELEKELDSISESEKKEYLAAVEKCPHLFSDDKDNAFKLMFLRCEIFNAKLAAERLVKYWKTRVSIFGEDKAFLPMVLGDKGPFDDSDGISNDYTSMKIGFVRSTGTRDDAGRPILFGDPSRMPMDHSSYDVKSMVRAMWYTIHHVLLDETAQRKGAVIVMFPKNVQFGQFNRKLAKMNAESIKGCLPIRVSAIHICHPPIVFDLIFPIIKVLMGSKLRKKIHLSSGSEEKVLEKLEQKFGVKKNDLPTELGGSLILDQVQWLEERKRHGE